MAIFRYKAISAAGDMIDGQMEAASADEVVIRLQDGGNIPVEAKLADAGDSQGLFARLGQRTVLSQNQILQFTQQLATLLGAGQPLDRALQILLDLPESEAARKTIERIRDAVRGGASLSTALEQQHGAFSRLYINMVRAGEVGGSLDETLTRLADYLERSKALKESFINAMIYPAILVIMVVLSLIILMAWVVPQFIPLFDDMGVELTLLTQVVFGAGNLMRDFWWLFVVVVAVGVWLLRQQLSDPERRLRFDAWILQRKLIGSVLVRVDTARLARTLGTLVHNGVPLLSALSIGRNVVSNTSLAKSVDEAAEEVKTGGGLAAALSRSKQFPRLALQMVQVGEESGALDDMLIKVANTFDIEVKNGLDRLLAALVPIIIVIMAFTVALIMLAILIPIFDLTNAVG